MAQDSDFSLISVDADDEDDVVIQAGARSAATPKPGTDAAVPAAARPVEEASVKPPASAPRKAAATSAPAAVFDDADGELLEGLSDADRAEFAMAKARREARQQANRMVTTEEDLHSAVPFAHMQRTVIIAVLVAFVVFLIYWFVFKPLG
jgi:hypothetical protein